MTTKQKKNITWIISTLIGLIVLAGYAKDKLPEYVTREDTCQIIEVKLIEFKEKQAKEDRDQRVELVKLLMGSKEIEAKAKQMKKDKQASSVILEVLEDK